MADVEIIVLEDTVQKEEISHFHAPAIQHNPDGWGPCELPDQFKDIPYQPFSKGDRLGKVSKMFCYLKIS
jgi:translation initiation factor 3 subunit D